MDRNDFKDNGQLDVYQNVTEYASRLYLSYSVNINKIFIRVAYFFLLKNIKTVAKFRKLQKFDWKWSQPR